MLGYVAPDGRPLVAPVWFIVDDGELVFNTGRDTAKGRALARIQELSSVSTTPTRPTRSSRCRGSPYVQDGAEDLFEVATRIGGRYMGAHRAKEFGQRNAVSGELVVRVHPTKVNSGFNIAD